MMKMLQGLAISLGVGNDMMNGIYSVKTGHPHLLMHAGFTGKYIHTGSQARTTLMYTSVTVSNLPQLDHIIA